jgi:hypothetical protein
VPRRRCCCCCCRQAIGSIHLNPALALAPIPVTSLPVLYKSLRGSEQVTPAEQEEVRGWVCMCLEGLCLWPGCRHGSGRPKRHLNGCAAVREEVRGRWYACVAQACGRGLALCMTVESVRGSEQVTPAEREEVKVGWLQAWAFAMLCYCPTTMSSQLGMKHDPTRVTYGAE